MIEKERKNIIKNIENELEMLEIKNEKIKQLNEIEQRPLIQKYLKLKEEIELISNNFRYLEGKENKLNVVVYSNFARATISKDFSPCTHSLWMYIGSYYEWMDYYCEHSHDILVDDENDKKFEFNRYRCLECNKYVTEKDWKKFEETHFVLKDRNQLDASSYHELYFQLLYENTISEAQEKLIEIFKENGKTKVKK